MRNLRGFQAIYVAWSEIKPSYVKIIDRRRGNSVKVNLSKTVFTHTEDIAKEYLNSLGIEVIGSCMADKGFYLVSDNFDTPLT